MSEQLKANVRVWLDDDCEPFDCFMYFAMVEHRGEFCAKETARVLTTDGHLLEFPGDRVTMVEVLCSGYRELNDIVNKYLEDAKEYNETVEEIDYSSVDTTVQYKEDSTMFG